MKVLPDNRLPHSLATRLSLWVVSFVMLMFVVVVWVMLWFAKQTIKGEAMDEAEAALAQVAQRIDNSLQKVETAVNNITWNMERHLDTPDSLQFYCQQFLRTNPFIASCAVAFKERYYAGKEPFYMDFYTRDADVIRRVTDTGSLHYVEHDWFSIPMLKDSNLWADPSSVKMYSKKPITSFCVPLHDASLPGSPPVAVFGADISLDSLSRATQYSRPSPNAQCNLLSRRGSFIIHADSAMLRPGAALEHLESSRNKENLELVSALLNGEKGMSRLELDGEMCYVFYRPFTNAAWSVYIVWPERDIFAKYYRLRHLAFLLSLVSLLALLVFSRFYLKLLLRPLAKLDNSARLLAEGHFDERVEATSRLDEVGHLQRAFRAMQNSLDNYLEKITQRRQQLDEQGEALKATYHHIQEANHAKNAFMHSATDQLKAPANDILQMVTSIHEHQDKLSQKEITHLTEQMMADTATITQLLDRMIIVSTGKRDIEDSPTKD